jgi:hypothetical protein
MKVPGLPWPSALRWMLVLKPPWLRPKASVSGSLCLPQRHADGLGCWCDRPGEASHRMGPRPRPAAAGSPRDEGRRRRAASGRSGSRRCATDHTVRANRARERQYGGSRGSHCGSCGGHGPVAQSSVVGVGAVIAAAPIACWSNLRGAYSIVYRGKSNLQTRPRIISLVLYVYVMECCHLLLT